MIMIKSTPPQLSVKKSSPHQKHGTHTNIILPDENPLDHFAAGIRTGSHFVGRLLRFMPLILAGAAVYFAYDRYVSPFDEFEGFLVLFVLGALVFSSTRLLVKELYTAPGMLRLVLTLGGLALLWTLIPVEWMNEITRSFDRSPVETAIGVLVVMMLLLSTVLTLANSYNEIVRRAYRSRTRFVWTVLGLSIRISVVITLGWIVLSLLPYSDYITKQLRLFFEA